MQTLIDIDKKCLRVLTSDSKWGGASRIAKVGVEGNEIRFFNTNGRHISTLQFGSSGELCGLLLKIIALETDNVCKNGEQ